VILVYLGGGLSHHDSFDLKPDAIDEIRGKYQPIATNVSGLVVGELLPMMAKTMDKVCLVRSGAHNNDHHETATNWVMSGRFGSAFGDWPAMGAVAAHESGFPGTLPPYVSIPRNPSFTWELGKSAYLGGRYESFKAGDPNQAGYRVRDVAQQEPLPEVRVQRRQSLLKTVDGFARRVEGNDQLKLRVYVSGGGCSGFQYGFTFDEIVNEDDTLVTKGGVSLLIDAMSYQYLVGAEIDYKEDLHGSQFVIKNPNATTTCGCGSSFSV